MGNNSFGQIFRITTWGEPHGKAIGVVIDGCPAGVDISEADIQKELALRQPGRNAYVSPRKESDQAEILSGIYEGKTTGAPISIIIYNRDVDSSKYEPIKDLLRPGHANYTYLEKYGIFDYRGGGRSSARETACRVAAGAIAKKILALQKIQIVSFVKEIGGISLPEKEYRDLNLLKSETIQSPIFCPDPKVSEEMIKKIEEAKALGDSLGAIVECVASAPRGLGDPVYEKLEANLAKAMLSIPATKGIEFGAGFQAARMRGSEHNDIFTLNDKDEVVTQTNYAGGTLGGISTGMPIVCRVAFKPTSSIKFTQQTLDINNEKKEFKLPEGSRHDPCVGIRGVPVIEAMFALCLVDALIKNRSSKI